ncbi:MAG: FlgD immunoglobulin-like domain containing protein [Calditrichia bacterium]
MLFSKKLLIYCLFLITIGLSSQANAQLQQAPIGMNISGVKDWSSQLPFVDVFKSARNWIPQNVSGGNWNTGDKLQSTPDGWIAQLDSGKAAATLLCRGLNGNYPAGEYICLYDGEGTLQFGFDAAEVNSAPGRIVLNVTPGNGGIYLKLIATNPANPLRNIRVIMPGFEGSYQSDPFYPPFLDMFAGYKSIRFMDWMETNNSPLISWTERTTPDYFTFAGEHGVSLEIMIELANRLEIDPWFCMPHQADDNFVQQFATMVKNNLKTNLKPYVEYSNEVWNGQFSQAQYARQKGLLEGLSTSPFEAQLRYYSQRTIEIFSIWTTIYGEGSFQRVLASQSANPWTASTILDWNNAASQADMLAIAPYFGNQFGSSARESEVEQWSVEQLLDSCAVDVSSQYNRMLANFGEASSRNLELIAYEAGQHLVGTGGVENNTDIEELFKSANKHPGMKDIYIQYLNAWNNAGGGLIAMFSSCGSYSKWGSWGILEYLESNWQNAPKYLAVQEYLSGVTGIESPDAEQPTTFVLQENFPNPFNPQTTIRFSLLEAASVQLSIFDVSGHHVRTLADGWLEAGSYSLRWNGTHQSGEPVASGTYFYQLRNGTQEATKRMTLLK